LIQKKSILSKINSLASSLMAFDSLFSSIQHRRPHKSPTKTAYSQHQQTHFWVSNPDKTAPCCAISPPLSGTPDLFDQTGNADLGDATRALPYLPYV
jgi:hypothetical protein